MAMSSELPVLCIVPCVSIRSVPVSWTPVPRFMPMASLF